MYLGRVVGSVWCTVKNEAMTGCRFLLVQPLTPELESTGKPLVCSDSTGAGVSEIIYWVRGKEATFPFLPAQPAFDTTIVGIVDSIHLKAASAMSPLRVSPSAPPRKAARKS